MKSKTLPIAIAAILTIAACKKEKDNINPDKGNNSNNGNDTTIVNPPTTEQGLSIKGVEDVHIGVFGKKELNLEVNCTNCDQQSINLSVTGVPESIVSDFSPQSGQTKFNTVFKTVSTLSPYGVYPIGITAKSQNGTSKTYNANIIVDTPNKIECNYYFIEGTHYDNYITTIHSADSTAVDSLLNGNKHKVSLHHDGGSQNLYLGSILLATGNTYNSIYSSSNSSKYHLLINYHCNNSTVTIPEQVLTGKTSMGPDKTFTVKGSGHINKEDKTYVINYTSTYIKNGSTVTESFSLTCKLMDY